MYIGSCSLLGRPVEDLFPGAGHGRSGYGSGHQHHSGNRLGHQVRI